MSRDDKLLRALAELQREQDQDALGDPRWEQVARGQATAEVEAELARAAAEEGHGADAVEAFSPLSREAEDNAVRAALAELQAAARQTAPRHDATDGAAGGKLLSLNSRRRSRRKALTFLAGGFGLAAAASVLLALGLTLGPAGGPSSASWPEYSLSFAGGEQLIRGASDSSASQALPVLRPGSTFTVTLRPARPTSVAPQVRAYRVQGQTLKRWPVQAQAQVSAEGAVRIQGELGAELDLPAGECTLLFVVGRPGTLPRLSSPGDQQAGPSWRVLRLRVRVIGP